MKKDHHHYNILSIEDNEGDFVLIQEYLGDAFLTVDVVNAKSFGDAKNILSTPENDFHIILLDLTLPDKNGESLIRELTAITNNLPVIVLTGHSDESFAVTTLSLGISDYLLKDNLTVTILYKSIIYNIERNRFIQQLKESERRYSDLFQLSPQPMWVYDIETFCILDVNIAAIEHYGYSHHEFTSMTIKDIRPAEDLDTLEGAIKESRSRGEAYFHGEFRHRKKNGDVINVGIESNSIFLKGRKCRIILAFDITERLQHLHAIEEQNKKLKEIAWTQAHVVRAPLSRMMGIMELLKNPSTSDDDQSKLLSYLSVSADELDEVIRDITSKTKVISPGN